MQRITMQDLLLAADEELKKKRGMPQFYEQMYV
jgi:hypothetical protein